MILMYIRRIYDQYLQQWSTDIRASPKAEVYCMIKSDNNLEIEKYITVVKITVTGLH